MEINDINTTNYAGKVRFYSTDREWEIKMKNTIFQQEFD